MTLTVRSKRTRESRRRRPVYGSRTAVRNRLSLFLVDESEPDVEGATAGFVERQLRWELRAFRVTALLNNFASAVIASGKEPA